MCGPPAEGEKEASSERCRPFGYGRPAEYRPSRPFTAGLAVSESAMIPIKMALCCFHGFAGHQRTSVASGRPIEFFTAAERLR